MPKGLRKDITSAKELLDNADTILVITAAEFNDATLNKTLEFI